jgi:anti-anti-sigma regulatory factor
VDLREVTFLSFTGLRILVCFAQTLRGGRRLLLQTKGPDVRTLLKACDWDALPNLALEPQEAHDV